jgi:hypothetical protein
MALPSASAGEMSTTKRKHLGGPESSSTAKRARNDANGSSAASVSHEPLQSLFSDLSPKYDIKSLSVLSSSTISKRVDSALQHLSRFDLYDASVLPGVVLLYARSNSANKLITIAETVRRRIHEGGHKWYQYNRLYEMEWAAKQRQPSTPKPPTSDRKPVVTLVEDTIMSMDGQDGEEEEDDDDFETMQPRTVFERAVHGEEKAKQMACMSIFLSRIPVPELKAMENFAVQSNEEHINLAWRKKAGLAG